MSEPFLGEMRFVAFNFARGWAFCDGQLLPINQNQSLYALLGTTYGGDGRTSFALPDLRGRAPMHRGNVHSLGSKPGSPTVTLAATEMPAHSHSMRASDADGEQSSPIDNYYSKEDVKGTFVEAYSTLNNQRMNARMITNAGGSQEHMNMQPYLTVNCCIALMGLFPSRN